MQSAPGNWRRSLSLFWTPFVIASIASLFPLAFAQTGRTPASVWRYSRDKTHLLVLDRPAPPPLTRKGRELLSLDGAWRSQSEPPDGSPDDWKRAFPPEAKEITVPSLLDAAAPGKKAAAWYWRDFETPDRWQGQTVRLEFGAAAERAEVWLNGERLGEHRGGVTPFTFHVTKQLRIGARNLLAVRVEGREGAKFGLWQGVRLLSHDEAYIGDSFPQSRASGDLSVAVELENTSDKTGGASLDARIVTLGKPEKELVKTLQNLLVTPGRNVTTLLVSARKKMKPWTPANPVLYRLQLRFRQENDILDTQDTIFGFREWGFRQGAILLNDAPVTLLAARPETPQPWVLSTPEQIASAQETIRLLRDRAVSLIYLTAPPTDLLRAADEAGMLVVVGPRLDQPAEVALEELRALVRRDRGHPSILAWNLLGLADASSETIAAFRALDPTRFLLIGSPDTPRLLLPDQAEPIAVSPPPGFLPPAL
jgi:beta-galactosidase